MSFKQDENLAPIPFNLRVLRSALSLKKLGLDWQPHVGCFVWDEQGKIGVPSPFPNDVYFILSPPRFTAIFGSIEKIKEALVWVPTWHQAQLLYQQWGLVEAELFNHTNPATIEQPEDHLLRLYDGIANHLSDGDGANETGASDGR